MSSTEVSISRAAGVGLHMIKTRLPQAPTSGKRGPKTAEDIAATEEKAKAVLARINGLNGALSLKQAVAMQNMMVCAHCGGKLVIEQDDSYHGRLLCLLCSRTVKDVRLDTSCQIRQN